ncbi:MAG TPA: molybdate ABC transporter substrate-binding protein [Candidatus Merdenecus merdavium]|nr:molybdate ABC transporter substrate-binding protein [Candidatus Merdenecus merdavium]
MKKKVLSLVLAGCLVLGGLVACSSKEDAGQETNAAEVQDSESQETQEKTEEKTDDTKEAETEEEAALDGEEVKLLVAAAASLEYSFKDELIPMFQEKYPNITVEGTYDSSGKLQTQIEEGLEADVFVSAAMKQMNELSESGLVDQDSVVELLENKIVLIVPAASDSTLSSFEDIANVEGNIALGDPESVPVGQYSQEALTNLNLWDSLNESGKISLGTNVTEVLQWVANGSADAGIVYATDAAQSEDVKIVAEAPEGSLEKKVIYPMGIVAATKNQEAAKLFEDFLASDEALAVFENYGFTPNK